MSNEHKITALLLSGGAGTRLGGCDKGLENHLGKPLIEHVISRISGQADEIIICINRNHEHYSKYGYKVILDEGNDQLNLNYQGPLAGITSALRFVIKQQTDFSNHSLLISSCDTPRIPLDYASKLHLSMNDKKATSAVVFDGSRKQNLHCLIKSSAWSSLLDFYDNGGRAMHLWHKKNGSIEVDYSDQAALFSNLNTADLLK